MCSAQAARLATSSENISTESIASESPETTTALGAQAWLRSSGCM